MTTSKTEGEAARKDSTMLREPRAAISWRRGLWISRVQALLAVFSCGWKSGDENDDGDVAEAPVLFLFLLLWLIIPKKFAAWLA